MIKYLLLALTAHFAFASPLRAEEANFSPFTIEQIARHLGLQGGNWEVSLADPCFLGFIATKSSAEGKVSRDVSWSRISSRQHRFFLSHHVTPGSGEEQLHDLSYSSEQVAEDQSSSGSGRTRGVYLPQTGAEYFATEGLKVEQGEKVTLYSWETDKSERAFRLDIVFSPNKEEK